MKIQRIFMSEMNRLTSLAYECSIPLSVFLLIFSMTMMVKQADSFVLFYPILWAHYLNKMKQLFSSLFGVFRDH